MQAELIACRSTRVPRLNSDEDILAPSLRQSMIAHRNEKYAFKERFCFRLHCSAHNQHPPPGPLPHTFPFEYIDFPASTIFLLSHSQYVADTKKWIRALEYVVG